MENSSLKRSRISLFLQKLNSQKYLQAMAIPGIIWMIIFCYIPMYGIIIAFKHYNITMPIHKGPWVGLMHFQDFFRDEMFYKVLKNTLGISILKLVIGFPLPIIFALLLNELRSLRFKRIVQTVSYLPHFLSWVVLGGIMMTWFEETGIGTRILYILGIIKEPLYLFAYPEYFWCMAVLSDIWKELGWSAIIYLAAIAGIDQSLYEAAIVDGAGRIRRIISVTIPGIKLTVAILFILSVSGLMNTNFEQIFVLKNPLNTDASNVVDIFVYRMGIQTARFSYATAIGLFKSAISLILLLTANSVTKKLTDSSLF